MNISKKAVYALKAVTSIARDQRNKPIQISEISEKESIPVKFLEQILLNLKNNGILKSKRGVNGGYLLAKSMEHISIGMILEIIDGRLDPVGLKSGNDLSPGLDRCFSEMVKIINKHLNQFTIKKIIETERQQDLLSFEI